MPKSTNLCMPRDLLTTLDPDIVSVEYEKAFGCLKLRFGFGEYVLLTGQDLITLQRFLKQTQEELK